MTKNASNSKNQNLNQYFSRKSFQNVANSENRDKFNENADDKARIYTIEEEKNYDDYKNDVDEIFQTEESSAKIFREAENDHDNDYNYYISENLNYYESYNQPKKEPAAFFITSNVTSDFKCHRCKKCFLFNNKLHLHLRKAHAFIEKTEIHIIHANLRSYKSFAKINNVENSFAGDLIITSKIIKNFDIFIIIFNVNAFKKIDIKYDFRK